MCGEVSAVWERFEDGDDLVDIPTSGGGNEMTGLQRKLDDLVDNLKTV